jgi:Toxin SymE, type I toxin-antitoxin system
MSSPLSDAIRRLPALSRPRRRRVRKAVDRPVEALRMSGRWLEEHGFAIGSGVQVLVEHGRVTLISGGADGVGADPR